MKHQWLKKALALGMACLMTAGVLAGCGSSNSANTNTSNSSESAAPAASSESEKPAAESTTADGGKILYLSNLTSGAYYDYYVAFYQQACADLGYKFEVVYGDGYNDPDGNLTAVRNAYTSDVVAMIACQDGGLEAIMEEYPDMYVATINSNMDSIYTDGGVNAGLLENDHYLGSIGDGYIAGEDKGHYYADLTISKGVKKIAVMHFPTFAYPDAGIAASTFYADIEEYNKTADEPIEIVGDPTVLEFKPLDASFFMEEGHGDLDAIVGICAGTTFIYPTMLNAKADGTCSADTILLTSGYENVEDLYQDSGDDGQTIGSVLVAVPEAALYPLVMIDNALQGKQFADWTGPERIDSGILSMETTEQFAKIHDDSPLWAADISKLAVSWDEMKNYFTRYNENATYAELVEMVSSISIDDYMAK